jgi:hypothetical protein
VNFEKKSIYELGPDIILGRTFIKLTAGSTSTTRPKKVCDIE